VPTPRTVAELVADARHAAPLDGAARTGEAAGGEHLLVRVGLWLRGDGQVARAAYRATTCAALIAYAETACVLAEERGAPCVDAARLRGAVRGVHPVHHDRADLVVLAFARAGGGASPGGNAA
jgi:hypothetical protein